MSKHRRAAKVDENQKDIVSLLRSIPGVSVETGHDDILVGIRGVTYWFEIKSKAVISTRTNKVRESNVKESQKRLRDEFKGHYSIVSSIEEILKEIGIETNSKR